MGKTVSNNSIRTAGDDLTEDIREYMSRQHNVQVSERMAERIKGLEWMSEPTKEKALEKLAGSSPV